MTVYEYEMVDMTPHEQRAHIELIKLSCRINGLKALQIRLPHIAEDIQPKIDEAERTRDHLQILVNKYRATRQ